MTYAERTFMGEESQSLLDRFADYVRPYPAKVLARTLGCSLKTAENFRGAASWPNHRHWKLIVRAFGRDVISAVFMPEIDDTLARLEREARQLEIRLAEINARRRSDSGGLPSPEERRLEAQDWAPLEPETLDLFEPKVTSAHERERSNSHV